MTDLLQEILTIMEKHKKTPTDVSSVVKDGEYVYSWEEFVKFASRAYVYKQEKQTPLCDLVIYFKDGSRLERCCRDGEKQQWRREKRKEPLSIAQPVAIAHFREYQHEGRMYMYTYEYRYAYLYVS